MSESMKQLIEEAIKLELNMADIYVSFHDRFPEDAGFWWGLAVEEKKHASLIMHCKQHLLNSELFPSETIDESLAAIIKINNTMEGILRQEAGSPPPDRAIAFRLALELEESAGEIHFQHAVQKTEQTSDALKLLQSLNKDDKDHADRVRNYMSKHGLTND